MEHTKSKVRSSAVEQRTLNPQVAGSNPAAPAKKSKYRDPDKRLLVWYATIGTHVELTVTDETWFPVKHWVNYHV